MNDLVQQLRRMGIGRSDGPWPTCHKAADEIERLRVLNAELVAVLEAVDVLWDEVELNPEVRILHARVCAALAKARESV